MQRVGAELVQNGLQQSFADLSFEFSTTLDQDNPLASRYLRVFPAANVFGWTNTSPGVKAQSEKSLLYHMAHMTHITQGVSLFNPLREDSPTLKTNMSDSMWKVLEGNSSYSPVAREAWLSHGRVKKNGLGFDNPDLNAYDPLLYSSQDSLLEAKALGCKVRRSSTHDELEQALLSILSNQQYLAYNLNAVWDAFQKYAQDNATEYKALRNQLVSSEPLMRLLNAKLRSPQTGLLMKIEYYSFYKELTGNTAREVEALILEQVRYFLLAQDLVGSGYDIRDFREALLLSVASHQLAQTPFYLEVIHLPEVQNATLYALVWTFLKQSPPEAERLVSEVVEHPKVENDTLRAAALWVMNHGTSEEFDILQTILAHPELDAATLGTVAAVLAKYNLQANEALVKKLVAHPNTGSFALNQATLAIWKHSIEIDNSLLEDILSHPSIDKWGVHNVARVIGDNREPETSYLLLEIVNHEQVDAAALTRVVIALTDDNFDGESKLLHSIRNHPRADARTLGYIDRAVATKNHSLDQAQDFL